MARSWRVRHERKASQWAWDKINASETTDEAIVMWSKYANVIEPGCPTSQATIRKIVATCPYCDYESLLVKYQPHPHADEDYDPPIYI